MAYIIGIMLGGNFHTMLSRPSSIMGVPALSHLPAGGLNSHHPSFKKAISSRLPGRGKGRISALYGRGRTGTGYGWEGASVGMDRRRRNCTQKARKSSASLAKTSSRLPPPPRQSDGACTGTGFCFCCRHFILFKLGGYLCM